MVLTSACLCENCINAIKSRGEQIFVGKTIEFDMEPDETRECDFCEEDFDGSELYRCIW